jgi:hypothetical protein
VARQQSASRPAPPWRPSRGAWLHGPSARWSTANDLPEAGRRPSPRSPPAAWHQAVAPVGDAGRHSARLLTHALNSTNPLVALPADRCPPNVRQFPAPIQQLQNPNSPPALLARYPPAAPLLLQRPRRRGRQLQPRKLLPPPLSFFHTLFLISASAQASCDPYASVEALVDMVKLSKPSESVTVTILRSAGALPVSLLQSTSTTVS